jgi:leader peptidase (prepilin peptidase)/N-methyltransferase
MLELLQDSAALQVALAGGLGLLVGSFINVVSLRLPRLMEFEWRSQCAELEGRQIPSESPPGLVWDRSHCPHCGHGITALQNIPLVSYVALRGRCASCGTRISAQYPVVEALAGGLAAWVMLHFGLGPAAVGGIFFSWMLLAGSVIDIREQLLPDSLTLPLLWGGLLFNLGATFVPLRDAVIGAIAGYLALWLVYHGFRLLTGKEGMGYGDFKLLAAVGAWLGWQVLPVVILFASLVGVITGIGMILFLGRDRQLPIPFGPYLAAAGFLAMLYGEAVLNAYLRYSGLSP